MDLKNEKGVVIIEATIALSAFMFFIVTILTIVNICYAQAKIGTALNETAKELSEYSYLYALTGINERQAKIYGETEKVRSEMEQSIQGIGDLYDALKEGTEDVSNIDMTNLSESIDKIKADVEAGSKAKSQLEAVFDEIADDPKAFLIGFGKLLGNSAFDYGKSKLIAAPITKCMMKRHLKSEKNGDCESFLKALKVVQGSDGKYIDGIRFDDSVLFPNGEHSIKLVAKYKVKVIPLLPIDMEFEFCQSAETNGWFGG